MTSITICPKCESLNVLSAESNNSYGCICTCFDCGCSPFFPTKRIFVYTEGGWDLPYDYDLQMVIDKLKKKEYSLEEVNGRKYYALQGVYGKYD